jgi:hypothetical protein
MEQWTGMSTAFRGPSSSALTGALARDGGSVMRRAAVLGVHKEQASGHVRVLTWRGCRELRP